MQDSNRNNSQAGGDGPRKPQPLPKPSVGNAPKVSPKPGKKGINSMSSLEDGSQSGSVCEDEGDMYVVHEIPGEFVRDLFSRQIFFRHNIEDLVVFFQANCLDCLSLPRVSDISTQVQQVLACAHTLC